MENLDCMTPDELMGFWKAHADGHGFRDLFPDEQRRGVRVVTQSLANYAANKATAMQCRERGDIPTALMYEGIADRIYGTLPTWARW